MTDHDPTKWNSACDVLQMIIMKPHPELRGAIWDEHCCVELDAARAELLQFIKDIRK